MVRKIVLLCCLLASQSVVAQGGRKEIEPYIDFLEEQIAAKEYILGLFDEYDIVVLCERSHGEMTQYELIQDLIADPRFIDECGNVLFETCSENYKGRIDSLLFAENLPASEVRARAMRITRDMSLWPWWTCSSVVPYFEHIYRVNQSLDRASKIELYPLDMTFDWNKTRTVEQRRQSLKGSRDSMMAVNTVRYLPAIFERGEKALIIQNHSHGFRETPGWYLTRLLEMVDRPIANVFIYNVATTDHPFGDDKKYALIQGGKWDAAFISVGKDFGFDLADSPFGGDNFDYVLNIPSEYNYSDIFTGMVYYKSPDQFVYSWGYPDKLDKEFVRELQRRYWLQGGGGKKIGLNRLKRWYKGVDTETCEDYVPDFYDQVGKYL